MWVAKPPPDGDEEHGHRRTSTHDGRGGEAVDEDITRTGKVGFVWLEDAGRGDARGIVAHAEILLEHGVEHEEPEIRLGVFIFRRVVAIVVEMPRRFRLRPACVLVEHHERGGDIETFRPAQALGATQVHQRDVHAG